MIEQEQYKRLWATVFAASIIIISVSCTKIGASVSSVNSQSYTTTYRPNIILILADDIGYEALTCNGGGSYDTHFLDSIAGLYKRYTWEHSCPVCSPSRVELLTGKYNFRNYTEWGVLETGNKTIGNMFQDAGYKTAVFGKWQLGGGVTSTQAFGFDSCFIFEPFENGGDEGVGNSRYRNPDLYWNGEARNFGNNEFGDDILVDSIKSFMANSIQPFFIYYPLLLCHSPFQPTPDDPDYLSFDISNNHSDTKYFPSMVKYMDKKVNEVFKAVDSLGISDNTIIIFVGDNGTPATILSLYNGTLYHGGKHKTIEMGTHVPLIVKGVGIGVDSSLIDFSDFLPTLAEMAGISKPTNYGILDGTSFIGSVKRDWIFCQYWNNPDEGDSSTICRWVQGKVYKLYDTLAYPDYKKGALLKYNNGRGLEREGGIINILSQGQQRIKNNYQSVLNTMH